MAKKIGMGLDLLLSSVQLGSKSASPSCEIHNLMITRLRPGNYQPRVDFDEKELIVLADSIKQHGVLQPLIVRSLGSCTDNGNYEIIAGERRWRAAQLAELTELPVIIRKLTDQQALAIALIENIQRENLSTWELVLGLQRLVHNFQLTHDEVAKIVGRSRSGVSNLLRLLELPDFIQQQLQLRKLDMGHARALLSLHDVDQQLRLAKQIESRQLSVRDTELLARQLLRSKSGDFSKSTEKNNHDEQLGRYLTEQLALPIRLKSDASGGGKMIISYRNAHDRERLLAKLKMKWTPKRDDD